MHRSQKAHMEPRHPLKNGAFFLLFLLFCALKANAEHSKPSSTSDHEHQVKPNSASHHEQQASSGPKQFLSEQVWIHQEPPDSVGKHIDTVLELKSQEDQWLLSTYILFYSRQKDQKKDQKKDKENPLPQPIVKCIGPFGVTIQDGLVIVYRPKYECRYTYRFDGDTLVFPALIRLSPQTFISTYTLNQDDKLVETPKKPHFTPCSYTWRCSANFEKVPKGEARLIVDTGDTHQFIKLDYEFEESPSERSLRFWKTNQEGIKEKFNRFLWHPQNSLESIAYEGISKNAPLLAEEKYCVADESIRHLIEKESAPEEKKGKEEHH